MFSTDVRVGRTPLYDVIFECQRDLCTKLNGMDFKEGMSWKAVCVK